ncbi:MAG: ParA family protein [Cyanobacteria bacterium P01_E01_bin.35]
MTDQIILVLLSEAGGVGKTTIAVNVAYEWSLRGRSVAIIDLDNNHSLDAFVGLKPERDLQKTTAKIFDRDFDGSWPLKHIFGSELISVCQGCRGLKEVGESLVLRKRREYALDKILKTYPIECELIILDCRAGFDLITENALAACTDILIPVDMGVKARTVSSLVNIIWQEFEELELSPAPRMMGLIPNHYNKDAAFHEDFIEALTRISQQLEIKLYPPLRTWQYLNNSAILGKPLKLLRSGDPMNSIFSDIVDDLEKIKENKSNG